MNPCMYVFFAYHPYKTCTLCVLILEDEKVEEIEAEEEIEEEEEIDE